MNDHRSHPNRARGQALVEFALVIPIFIVMLVSLFDLGSAVFSYTSVTNAAREGARLAIVNQDVASVLQRAKAQTAIAEINDPSVSVTFYQPRQDGTPNTAIPCAAPVATGCLAVVTFQTTYQPITPIIASLLFPHGVTFTASTVLTVEYSCPNATILTAAGCPRQP